MILKRKKREGAEIVLFLIAFSSLFFLIGIVVVLFAEGLPVFAHVSLSQFLLGRRWYPTSSPPQFGALPLILGSLLVTAGGLLFAVPLGLFAGIFLAELCPPRGREILKPIVELLADIPSVVYGFFGVLVVAPFIRDFLSLSTGLTAFTASLILGIMAVPSIISVIEDAITSVPRSYKEASLALGATHWETLRQVVLPAASSGVGAAIILGAGRIIGETMAVLMVAGGAPVIPKSFFQPVRTLTATIAVEMGEAPVGSPHYHSLFGLAIILFLFTLVLNILVESLATRGREGRTR
ncbi:MAG TPA: phosphate ABC transporter permease subunit PstC [Candidatus Atribacteria bacterium]|uniref:phosphate ABC transporter permease subunit PstC n=1 Tax=Candidatus Sordicultor fermentans TaxID=1953203 RepID=UPI002A2BF7F5|nr:phosphate ABC transporter permease subunit PstC [Atribacterota bacterium]HOQ50531.1 phosphate ABC transporter permease subunit PstC [Candidatus Atribacteria bacterium]MDI9607171.1 phosphate ABC transporter permease subunit PstC [Atribacterota bacterium]HPT62862.1 phosphate ABC transporter permease subunit PstC [Candidatus Atribacteria bacterium]HPZ39274.1 phosphate ABC transporter permease subunit PstC [Candidatus Atribacteria bacterium]